MSLAEHIKEHAILGVQSLASLNNYFARLDQANTFTGANTFNDQVIFNGSMTVNGAVSQWFQSGVTSNTSQSINSAAEYNLEITLNDALFKRGRVLVRRQHGVLLPREHAMIWFENAAGQANSKTNNTTYLVSYSMKQGDSYLSQEMFSSSSDGIRISDCYISGNKLIILFFNGSGSPKTLNAYIHWEVYRA